MNQAMNSERKPGIGRRLRRWRQKQGSTQSKAAKALGVPLATYRNWEYDLRQPRGLALRALKEAISERTNA